jgi:hypothetical protein
MVLRNWCPVTALHGVITGKTLALKEVLFVIGRLTVRFAEFPLRPDCPLHVRDEEVAEMARRLKYL